MWYNVEYQDRRGRILRTQEPMTLRAIMSEGWQWNDGGRILAIVRVHIPRRARRCSRIGATIGAIMAGLAGIIGIQ